MEFVYDGAGVVGIRHNETQYFYRKDAQDNIIAILDNSGKVVVKYVYDAWGNHATLCLNEVEGVKALQDINDENAPEFASEYLIFKELGELNPFRYRGYYYDIETELYYLQTRYYDPEIGRFISQDSVEYADPKTINGLNLYAYCLNNPIRYIDPYGTNVGDDLRTVKTLTYFVLKAGEIFLKGLSKTTPGLGSNTKGIASMLGQYGGVISKVATVLNYAFIAISDIIYGVEAGKTPLNIITDIAFDFTAVALGAEIGAGIGALIGSFAPGAGNIIGAVIGGILGAAYMFVSKSPIVMQLKDALYDGVSTIINDIGNFFNDIGNAISRWFVGLFSW